MKGVVGKRDGWGVWSGSGVTGQLSAALISSRAGVEQTKYRGLTD